MENVAILARVPSALRVRHVVPNKIIAQGAIP